MGVPVFDISAIHGGKRPRDIYVLLSKDGSTVLVDPGLNRPWSSRYKKLAEDNARIFCKQGIECSAVTLAEAIESIIKHPKNLPDAKN